jgi:hypothetical protein
MNYDVANALESMEKRITSRLERIENAVLPVEVRSIVLEEEEPKALQFYRGQWVRSKANGRIGHVSYHYSPDKVEVTWAGYPSKVEIDVDPDQLEAIDPPPPFNAELNHTIMQEVVRERHKQHTLFGLQRHNWIEWLGILTEESMEFTKEVVDNHWHPDPQSFQRMTTELMQLVAVGVAMLEHMDEVAAAGETPNE